MLWGFSVCDSVALATKVSFSPGTMPGRTRALEPGVGAGAPSADSAQPLPRAGLHMHFWPPRQHAASSGAAQELQGRFGSRR